MSAEEELSKLSLGDNMVTTRAGAARARTAPAEFTQESSSTSPAASPTPSFIESADGQKYDVSAFDQDLRRRAKRGLEEDNDIGMKFCKEIGDETKRYIFHLDDDVTIAVDEKHVPKCSCGANEAGKACKHIFWILGQLTSSAPNTRPFTLAENGSSVRDVHPAEIIKKFTLDKIAKDLEWVYEEYQSPEEEEMLDEMTNMLSVFEPTGALPSEFRNEDTSDLPEQSRKYREFKDLLMQHATRNTAIFIQLQKIIPPAFQVQVFFDKINGRIDRAFKAFEEYRDKGPTNAPSEALDVVKCADRLRDLVEALSNYYMEQVDGVTDDNNIAARSVAALVKMLDGVVKRNFDAYAHVHWDHMPPRTSEENNLFMYLIGSTTEGAGRFVVDTLLTLPEEEVLRHFEEIDDVEEQLRGMPDTPPAYMDGLRLLLHENRKRSASESGGSRAKRPMQGGP